MDKNINQPLISIVTVVYNGAKTLTQTIESVINQTYQKIEYIIIDGGSTDGSNEIVKKYSKYVSLHISEPDNGLYDAMNKGITKANGEIIGIINSDDWYENNAIELIVSAFQKNPKKKIFHGDRFNVLNNGKKTIQKFDSCEFKLIYYGMTYNHPSMFIHKDIYKKNRYNTDLRVFSDYELILKIFLIDKNLFSYIPEAYVNYRIDGISSQISIIEKIKEGYISRKKAGLSFNKNILSVLIRFTSFMGYIIFKK